MELDKDIISKMINKPVADFRLVTTDNHYIELQQDDWMIFIQIDEEITPDNRYNYEFINYTDYIQFIIDCRDNKIDSIFNQ